VAVTRQERIELALSALQEVTGAAGIGEVLAVEEVEPGVVDVRFACTTSAYSGWHWTVSTADLPDQEPTVLEVELLPGDGALLAPPWVPWAERLAEWRRQHPEERHPGEAVDEDTDDDGDEDLDEDDLTGDDGIDALDEADLEGDASPQETEQDPGDVADEDEDGHPVDGGDSDEDDPDHDEFDEDDSDDRVRPALEDRSL
jgi:hypothetical protein